MATQTAKRGVQGLGCGGMRPDGVSIAFVALADELKANFLRKETAKVTPFLRTEGATRLYNFARIETLSSVITDH